MMVEEIEKWKELAHEWKAKEDELHAEMATEKQTKAKYLRQLTEAQTELKQANVLIEKQKVDMKFDKQAREGQVKRSRIMEHELKEIQAENNHQAELRAQAEAHARPEVPQPGARAAAAGHPQELPHGRRAEARREPRARGRRAPLRGGGDDPHAVRADRGHQARCARTR